MHSDYHINCSGCKKADKDTLIGKEEECQWCDGTGSIHIDEDGNVFTGQGEGCAECYGSGKREYIPRASDHYWARADYYGIYTGIYCDGCYNSPDKYPYKKNNYYDPAYAGERMDADY